MRKHRQTVALLSLLLGTFSLRAQNSDQTGGTAEIASQGYYLGGSGQPLQALTGATVAFQLYYPKLGFINGNLEAYDQTTRGRLGQNFVTLNGLSWLRRRWTISVGDTRVQTAMVRAPFTNYVYPEIGIRGAKVEMNDGVRQYSFFGGEETLQEGPRISFRVNAPQRVMGASVRQKLGSNVQVAVRLLDLASSPDALLASPALFPIGAEFTHSDMATVQAGWTASKRLSFFGEAGMSRATFGTDVVYRQQEPFSMLAGAAWETQRLTVRANYGSLSRSVLPALGFYAGDRRGPFVEARYRPFGRLEIFGTGQQSSNNLEHNPAIPDLRSGSASAGVSTTLFSDVSVSAQYSVIGVTSQQKSEPGSYQSQTSKQAQISLAKRLANHNLALTGRRLELDSTLMRQKQASLEVRDTVQFSRFLVSGGLRGQQQNQGGQLGNTLYVEGSGQVHFGRVSIYGQFEAGNDLVNKSLFATNSVHTTVLGVGVALPHGWTANAEAFRSTLISALNSESLFVLATQGEGITQILNDFDQWSFYVRFTHRVKWGAPVAENGQSADNTAVYGTIEGFVYEGNGTTPEPGISVRLDGQRTTSTDATGRYRFEDVTEGAHKAELNMDELPAEFSPLAGRHDLVDVKPRKSSRVDMRIVRTNSSIQGRVEGLIPEDVGVVLPANIVITIDSDGYTTTATDGSFGFFNLMPGQHRISIDAKSLPANYVPDSASEVTVDLTNSGSPEVVFRIRKQVEQLPVREVFQGNL